MTALRRLADDDTINDNTDAAIPTPDLSDFPVFGDNILIRPYQPPAAIQLKGGGSIILPPKVEADKAYLQNVGQIVKVGNLAWHDPNCKKGEENYPWGYFKGPWVKPGDWVVYSRNSGQKIMVHGIKMLLLKDTFILASVTNPEVIDPNYQTVLFDKHA